MENFGFGWLALVGFILFILGYWMGRDSGAKPMTISESGAPVLYGWAFVGLISWLIPMGWL
ncbi:hypothetical protein L4D08_26495 [Photobacterium chitinilyticum]|uniref:hypothetical protein n=1 Tax=Photobacterium chitinilyticum TaxID=2485123 RepID=UPI003D11E20D